MSATAVQRFGAALVATLLDLLLVQILFPWLQGRGMYMIGSLAIAGTALYGGFGPGLLAMVLIALGYQYLVLEPIFSAGIADASDLLTFILFMSLGLLTCVTGALLRRNFERVQALQRRYQSLVEDLDQAFVWSMATDTREIQFLSPGVMRTIGYPTDSLCTATEIWWDRIHPDDRAAMTALVARAWAGERDQRLVHRFQHRDGHWLWLKTSVHLVDEPGPPLTERGIRYLQGLSVDITPIREAVRQREDVLAVVAHDLKNPLSVILLTTSLLRDLGPEEGRLVGQIRRAAERMRDLIRDLLDASVVRGGQFALQPELLDLQGVVSGALDGVRPLADSKGIRLASRLPDHRLVVTGEERRLLQVLTNLLGNAVTHTPSGGTIEVAVDDLGDEALVSVRDTGSGISLADQAYLFDRFWRPERASKRGTGLGLYIAKGIVEAHGGRIWVESQPGAGSTFRFTVPKVAASARTAA